MKKILSITVIITLTLLQPAFAKENDNATIKQHNEHEIHIMNKDDAIKIINDGVLFMDEALNKNKAELFANGEVMDKMHNVTMHIEEAANFLEENTKDMNPENKKRLSSAIKQLLEKITDFHVATHEQNFEKSLVELKKIKGALQLINASVY